MVASSPNIKLNFFPIVPHEFQFNVWRKRRSPGEPRGDWPAARLPVEPDGVYDNYWVSCEPVSDFEVTRVSSLDNVHLTCSFIRSALLKRLRQPEMQEGRDYFLTGSRFKPSISLVINETALGFQTIILNPYFLQTANCHGILADYRFKRGEGVDFSREVQVLSLSLDTNYRSNRSFYIDRYELVMKGVYKYQWLLRVLDIGEDEVDIEDSMISLPATIFDMREYEFGAGGRNSECVQNFV